MAELLSIPEAAAELGVTRWAVWQLVNVGRLGADRVGRDWVIERATLEAFKLTYRPRRKRCRDA